MSQKDFLRDLIGGLTVLVHKDSQIFSWLLNIYTMINQLLFFKHYVSFSSKSVTLFFITALRALSCKANVRI